MTDTDPQESSGNDNRDNPESAGVPGAPFIQALGTGPEIAQQIGSFQRRIQEIGRLARKELDQYRKFEERLSRQLAQIDWDPVQKAVDELNETVEHVQSYLVDRGWYLPVGLFALSRVREISNMVEKDEHKKVEAFMHKYAESRVVPAVREAAPELFPRREEIIRQTLEAHENEHYTLTVPTFLSQAEGMFFEGLESHFYDEDEREESLRQLKRDPDTAFAILTMDHLFRPGPLHEDYSGNPREVARSRDSSFNRHLILHGHSTDYHTEANSLRAIALVGLTCRLVRRLDEK
jgi:hypothetical protein